MIFLIIYGDSVALVILIAIFSTLIVDIEVEISKLVVSVKLSCGVTVNVVFPSLAWSTKAVIVFIVLGGIVKASSVTTAWSYLVVSPEAL